MKPLGELVNVGTVEILGYLLYPVQYHYMEVFQT